MRRIVRMSPLARHAVLAICAVTLFGVAPAASAASIDAAKAAGQIGEAPDGYLHVVDAGAPADVKSLVGDINAKRKSKYGGIAKGRGIPIDAVAAQAGAKLVERAPAGQFVLNTDGSWRKK